jgi:ABC-2 type transport system ATP-binding protein
VANAVAVRGVSKRFRIHHDKSLKERAISFGRSSHEEFFALSDINLDIEVGATVGLLGHNGSGKSTLLKCVAGILSPTTGTITRVEKIAALLELGAGFQQDLTGRENVFLNGSILGMSKRDLEKRFDDIVAFSELDQFIDSQVKHYSSGMYVRLGFAIAVSVEPELLLIDEVLAVGDEAFQRKCLERVREFQREGRTIVFVTHVVDQVRRICTDAVMLQKGRVHASGNPEDVVREYRRLLLTKDVAYAQTTQTKDVEIAHAELLTEDGFKAEKLRPGDTLVVQLDLKANRPVPAPVVDVTLHDQHNVYMYGANTEELGTDIGPIEDKKRVRFKIGPLPYTSGKYWVTLAARSPDAATLYDMQEHAYSFEIPAVSDNPPVAFIPTDVEVEDL